MLGKIPYSFRKWLRDERGVVSVEAVIMFPMLLWAYGAMFIFWDAFKTQNVNVKATYTIADMISREPDPVNMAYIDGLNAIYNFLLDERPGAPVNNDIRVSVVSNRLDSSGNEQLVLEWSCGTGELLKHEDIAQVEEAIPLIAVNDQVIVVESRMDWTPPMTSSLVNFGLEAAERRQRIVTSPRFVPQVLFNGSCT